MMCAHPRRLVNGDMKLVASRAWASTTIGKMWTIFSFKNCCVRWFYNVFAFEYITYAKRCIRNESGEVKP